MSSCTSNSKLRKQFFLTLFLATFMFSIPCVMIYLYSLKVTNKNVFYTTASSKAKHMALNVGGASKPEIIFIGSSRTLFHIDTGYLTNDLHLKSYNYGLDGHIISSFPYMVEQAIKFKPKVIVINLDLQDLYSPPEATRDIYLPDMVAYIKTHQEFNFLITSLEYYIAGFNLVRQHATTIHQFIVGKTRAFASHETYHVIPNASPQNFGDCIPFLNKKNVGAGMDVIQCQNGDGILFGQTKLLSKKTVKLSQINPHTLELLKYSLDMIKKNHITPILVFSPMYAIDFSYQDINDIQSSLGVKIIDLTNLSIPAKDWANDSHLNFAGRELFTKKLYAAGRLIAWD